MGRYQVGEGRRPRVIVLENVEEFQDWGPLLDDGRPCPLRRGLTFRRWLGVLKNCGYEVDLRELRACDYGAPTSRKRLFIIARCDGQPIVWPEPTHGPGREPYLTAADCMEWSLPCPSIFERERPLAENTMRRIARGLQRYVIDSPQPFIVPVSAELAAPTLIQRSWGERPGQAPRALDLHKPLGTVVAGGVKHALVSAFLARHYSEREPYVRAGKSVDHPLPTVTTSDHHSLVTAFLAKHYGGVVGQRLPTTIGTVTCRDHHALVDAQLAPAPADGTRIGDVRAFLIKYFGTDQDPRLEQPLHTVTTKHRFGLVTIHGADYVISDIGMRMLVPRELFRAQGFPDSYMIDIDVNGRPLPKSAQVRMCGNSVCPPIAAAIVAANFAAAKVRPVAAKAA
jgi:DNA (cytosine-5)-methyltransferase 1